MHSLDNTFYHSGWRTFIKCKDKLPKKGLSESREIYEIYFWPKYAILTRVRVISWYTDKKSFLRNFLSFIAAQKVPHGVAMRP